MTRTEFAAVVDWLHSVWPDTPAWSPATIEETYRLFADVDAIDLNAAARTIFARGVRWRPAPSEIFAATKDAAAERLRYRPPSRALEPEEISLSEYLSRRGVGSWREAVGQALDDGSA